MHFDVLTGYFSAPVAKTVSNTDPHTVAGYFFVLYLVTFIGTSPSPYYGAKYTLLTISNVHCEWNRGNEREKMELPLPICPHTHPKSAIKVVNNERLILGALSLKVTEGCLRSTRSGQENLPPSRPLHGELLLSRAMRNPQVGLSADVDDSGNSRQGLRAHGPMRVSASRHPRA